LNFAFSKFTNIVQLHSTVSNSSFNHFKLVTVILEIQSSNWFFIVSNFFNIHHSTKISLCFHFIISIKESKPIKGIILFHSLSNNQPVEVKYNILFI